MPFRCQKSWKVGRSTRPPAQIGCSNGRGHSGRLITSILTCVMPNTSGKPFAISKIILRRQSWYSTQKPGHGAAQDFATLTDEYASDGRPLWRNPAAAAI